MSKVITFLKQNNLNLYKKLKNATVENVLLEQTKSGNHTLKFKKNGRDYYFHSKYNPVNEAVQFTSNIQISNNINHILFIGAGLGYHIEILLEQNPNVKFSIYEPDLEVIKFLVDSDIIHKYFDRMVMIFNDLDEILDSEIINVYLSNDNFNVELSITKNIYKEEVKSLYNMFAEKLNQKHLDVAITSKFQKRWVTNYIKNFNIVVNSPNFFQKSTLMSFKGKPVILVAAGPSLNLEIENLRRIKNEGRAFIVSVGSAINALLEYNIVPDLVCIYDPKEENKRVMYKIEEQKRDDIPIAFATTVGYESINDYNGPLFSLISDQDPFSMYLLDEVKDEHILLDVPSISIFTLQILHKLKVSQVILVGQNFAFLNNRRYDKSIQYKSNPKLSIDERKKLVEAYKENETDVLSVDGDFIKTSKDFLNMKRIFEEYINFSKINVVNSTQHGAIINGAQYEKLDILLGTILKEKNIVNETWYKANTKNKYSKEKLKLIKKSSVKYAEFLKNARFLSEQIIQMDIDVLSLDEKLSLIKRMQTSLNNIFNELYHEIIVKRMFIVQDNYYKKKYQENITLKDPNDKIKELTTLFNNYIDLAELNNDLIIREFEEMLKKINF